MNNLKFRVWSKKDNTFYYPAKFSGIFAMNIIGNIFENPYLLTVSEKLTEKV